jgi:hypothetical protein
LLVLTIAREPSAFLTSQVQLEPKLLIALSVNLALNSAKEPKAPLIASATAPVGSPPPVGLRLFQ